MRRPSNEQIMDWNSRSRGQPRLGTELIAEIEQLGGAAEAVNDVSKTYSDFVPIRLVTIMEVFLRGVIAELVNSDEIFFERGQKLVKGAKIDLAFAFHVNRHELTVGDFVAHSVSLNSIESAISVMDTLIPNFTSKIALSHPRWTEEKEEWPLSPIVEDLGTMTKYLNRLYEIRHILTHELPGERVYNSAEVSLLVGAARSFIDATDWVVVETVHGSVPSTQLGMNMSVGEDLKREKEALDRALEEFRSVRGVDQQALTELQDAWEEFADMQASFAASQVEGGSMHPMIWAGEKAALLKERVGQINRLKSEWMDV